MTGKPSKHEMEYWKKNKSWIKRYVYSSSTINLAMCGKIVTFPNESMWTYQNNTKKNIQGLRRALHKHKTVLKTKMILYRGTSDSAITMDPFDIKLKACSFMSCSKSKSIAQKFVFGKKGILHIITCHPNVHVTDIEPWNEGEKEVLIHPNTIFKLKKCHHNIIYWDAIKK
jgi:hypothetical protein